MAHATHSVEKLTMALYLFSFPICCSPSMKPFTEQAQVLERPPSLKTICPPVEIVGWGLLHMSSLTEVRLPSARERELASWVVLAQALELPRQVGMEEADQAASLPARDKD